MDAERRGEDPFRYLTRSAGRGGLPRCKNPHSAALIGLASCKVLASSSSLQGRCRGAPIAGLPQNAAEGAHRSPFEPLCARNPDCELVG